MSKLAVAIVGAGLAVGALAYQDPVASRQDPVAFRPGDAESRAGARDLGGMGALGRVAASPWTAPVDNEVVRQYCVRCHNDRRLLGGMSLERFDAADATASAELAERMIRKLRAGMMPPPGARRPDESILTGLAASLEDQLDRAAEERPNPGRRTFQRLNRAEYAASVRDLLDLEIDAGKYLPLDTKSANFDNIADVQLLSATLADGYLRAAAEVSRLALGDPRVTASEATYRVSRWDSQTERAEGAPYGTRGGVAVVHNFPADGEYVFRVSFHHETTGALYGNGRNALHTDDDNPEQLEISVDGEPVALLEVGRWMHASDPDGVNIRTGRVHVRGGPRRVAAAFVRRVEGPVQDLISPHEWSLASTSIAGSYGFTALPHLRDLAIGGPYEPSGVSETPSRAKVFSCRPRSPAEARPCARKIVERLGTQAYRRFLDEAEVDALMRLYDAGADAARDDAAGDDPAGDDAPSAGAESARMESDEGFEEGVRTALEGILASPHFVFRFEEPSAAQESNESPSGGHDGGTAPNAYPISDVDLAARLSFFLWGTGPDAELMTAARDGRLSDPSSLRTQTMRMLRDERASALSTRFAAQWLRLQDLEKIQPDVRVAPDFDQQLKRSMHKETELFFDHLVKNDRPLLELYTADYAFVDERLARHYGIPGVAGSRFRQVKHVNPERRGVLGHGSVLTLTSHAGRTSPVLRGKWVMEVLLGTPPPPPPPDVPELEEEAVEDGRFLTVRERMEMHRASPACSSCHRMIDPIGLALENFDVAGAWRIKDQGVPVDAAGELYDGTPLASPTDLRAALLKRPEPLIRTFTENLMAYALGRRLEHYDMPTVRRIARSAEAEGYRMSAFVLGVASSDAFRMKAVSSAYVEPADPDAEGAHR